MVLKFGGYDLSEAKRGIKVLKTINDANRNPTWGLLAKDIKFIRIPSPEIVSRHVHFNPSVPYMYVSAKDF